jgi:hypothetical protein
MVQRRFPKVELLRIQDNRCCAAGVSRSSHGYPDTGSKTTP